MLRKVSSEMLGHPSEAIGTVVAPFIRALLAPLAPAVERTEAQAGAALGLGTTLPAVKPSFTLAQHAAGVYLSSASILSAPDLVHVVRRLHHKALAQIVLEEQGKRLDAMVADLEKGSAHARRTGKRVSNIDRLALAEGYLQLGSRTMARRQLAALDPEHEELPADIATTFIRSPEIKRDMERLLGPDGLDMAWVVPQL